VELCDKPACVMIGDYCTISNSHNNVLKIMGRGKVISGRESEIYV
jgi:hypothetical protein